MLLRCNSAIDVWAAGGTAMQAVGRASRNTIYLDIDGDLRVFYVTVYESLILVATSRLRVLLHFEHKLCTNEDDFHVFVCGQVHFPTGEHIDIYFLRFSVLFIYATQRYYLFLLSSSPG